MPTYDYVCDGCTHEFEAFESIKADPQTLCPKCGETKLRRKIGAGAAILFKGSGFYITDYRSDSYKSKAKAESGGGEGGGGSGSGGKSEGSSSGSSGSSPSSGGSSGSSSSSGGGSSSSSGSK